MTSNGSGLTRMGASSTLTAGDVGPLERPKPVPKLAGFTGVDRFEGDPGFDIDGLRGRLWGERGCRRPGLGERGRREDDGPGEYRRENVRGGGDRDKGRRRRGGEGERRRLTGERWRGGGGESGLRGEGERLSRPTNPRGGEGDRRLRRGGERPYSRRGGLPAVNPPNETHLSDTHLQKPG